LFFFALFIDKIYVPVFYISALSNGSMAGGKTIRSTGHLYRQSGIIRFSVFSAITIQPQLFDAKSLQFFHHKILFFNSLCSY